MPVKCGYICVECRQSRLNEEKLCATFCGFSPTGCHRVVKRAVQCQHCFDLSNDGLEFAKKICPGDRPLPPCPTPSEAPTSPGSQPPVHPSPAQAEMFMELRMAEMEMARLVMLEALEKERAQLDSLLQAKRKATSDPRP